MATALVGSCGVSMTTTPSDVTTKLGLQPRSLVVVKTLGVTRSIIETACCMGFAAPRGKCSAVAVGCRLLGGGEATVDREDVSGHERGCVRNEEDGRPGHIAGFADTPEGDPSNDAGLERGVGQ